MRFILSEKNDFKKLIKFAKDNRRNQTKAERIIWNELRNSKLDYKFRRQVVIGEYIVDFACILKKIVVEIDGDSHNTRKDYDETRTKYLNDLGFKVIRFRNEEVYFQIENVLNKINEYLNA